MISLTNTLMEDYTYISKLDSAVDTDDEDFEHNWELYLDGKGSPPTKNGEKPTIFTLQHLTSTRHLKILQSEKDKHGAIGMCLAACAMALKDADNLRDDRGRRFKLERELVDDVWCLKQEHLDQLGAPLACELGARAISRLDVQKK